MPLNPGILRRAREPPHHSAGPFPMVLEINLNDRVRLRKPHPCGSTDWVVVRLGADIGLKCLGCGRRVLLPRRELAKRIKQRLPPVSSPPDS